MNNLTVDHHNLKSTKHRKSIIGKLDRSSFQAQRLSDVGVAFGQQITAKVGLKLPASQVRIVEQTRWLYLRYVFIKLRQNRLPLRDLNLTKSSRSRRAAALGSANESQIIVSISEPPSADAFSSSDQRPLFTRRSSRSRTALSADIDSQDLSLLAARINMRKFAQLDGVPEGNNQAVQDNVEGESVSTQVFTMNSNSGQQNGRKFNMDLTINNQIFSVIMNMINELRESKPEIYGDTIYEVIGLDKFSSLDSLLDVQTTICQEMTRSDISWDRITALFSLFGAMSVDCVRLGAPEHVGPILDGFIGFVERDLAYWISQQGGWESFLYKFRSDHRFGPLYKAGAIALPIALALFFVYN